MIYLYASQRRTEKMKTIAENINLKLQRIIRKHSKPAPDPLTQPELKTLEGEAMPVKVTPELMKPEAETVKDFDRKVERSSRALYLKLLERGASGATMGQIASDMEHEGASLPTLKATVEKMVKKGLIAETPEHKYAVTPAAKSTNEKVYEITIEKIYPNEAVIMVNDKFRARLTPEEYNGPKALIKKNSRFKATADLFRLDGTLCIRIKEVVEKLD
jgi:hypothetical protein